MGALSALAALVLAATSPSVPSGAAIVTEVDRRSGAVRLNVKDAPLAAVLEQLAKHLDVGLAIEGPRPEARVTVTLRADSPAALLKQLLEPRAIRYATGSDKEHRLKRLVVVTTDAPKTVIRDEPTATAEPTPQPFAQSVPEPVLPDHPSPPDEP